MHVLRCDVRLQSSTQLRCAYLPKRPHLTAPQNKRLWKAKKCGRSWLVHTHGTKICRQCVRWILSSLDCFRTGQFDTTACYGDPSQTNYFIWTRQPTGSAVIDLTSDRARIISVLHTSSVCTTLRISLYNLTSISSTYLNHTSTVYSRTPTCTMGTIIIVVVVIITSIKHIHRLEISDIPYSLDTTPSH